MGIDASVSSASFFEIYEISRLLWIIFEAVVGKFLPENILFRMHFLKIE